MNKIEEKITEIIELFKRIHDYNRSYISYKNDIEYCFVKCYHFKDFLKKNSEVNKTLKQYTTDVNQYVEDYINNNNCLQICGAIANRSKHYENKNNKKRADAKIEKKTFTYSFNLNPDVLTLNPGESVIFEMDPKPNCYKNDNPAECLKFDFVTELQEYIIKDDKGNTYKAIQLLNDCINAWLIFLNNHHLI